MPDPATQPSPVARRKRRRSWPPLMPRPPNGSGRAVCGRAWWVGPRSRGRLGEQPALLARSLPPGQTFRGFLIKGLRYRRRPALLGQGQHDDHPLDRLGPQGHTLTHTQQSRRLDPLFIDPDTPLFDGILSQTAGLEKPRRPEPFVEADRGVGQRAHVMPLRHRNQCHACGLL